MLVLQRLPVGMGNLASSGAVAMGRMVRTITAGVVLVVVTVTSQSVGVAAVAVYAHRILGRVRHVARDVLRRGGEHVKFRGLLASLLGLALARAGRRLRRELRPVRRVQAQGLGADPPRRRSTCRSTAPSCTSSSAPPSRSCSASPRCAGASPRVAGHPPDDRRAALRHRADAGCGDGAADEGDRALVPVRARRC